MASTESTNNRPGSTSRRNILRATVLGSAALAAPAGLHQASAQAANLPAHKPRGGDSHQAGSTASAARRSPHPHTYDFNTGWLFGGPYVTGSQDPGYDDSGFAQVTVPHTVVPLSWGNWDNTTWENIWIYRKHFALPQPGGRVFADFDAVMVDATVVLNGTTVATHQGGYLPFSAELTGSLADGDNVLAVIVDSRWLPVPPEGKAGGAITVDYLQPGGIYRDVALRVVPEVFVADVFARPADVLADDRSVQMQVTLDAASVPGGGQVQLTAGLFDGPRRLASTSAPATITVTGQSTAQLTLTNLGAISLWSPESPKLYEVVVTLTSPGEPPHTVAVTTGFREAVFQLDGFHLNGNRYEIFGLDRHQLFPYTGMAAPARLQRHDAELLKFDLNCNMVRCSHYPQSPHFLDACDELGLMVWQEPPGWGYVGDATWQQIVVQNVHDMVVRDRNRPSVILWATRLNETANITDLYAQTRQLAYDLDGTRQTSGAMSMYSTTGWAQDVFAYDDYDHSGGNATLKPPIDGVPYLVTEAVGALDGPPTYRWIDSSAGLGQQALLHAQVHNIAQSNPRYAGLLGWCGIDYASYTGGNRIWDALKTPGVTDTFRVAKPGATFYQSQLDPAVRPVIAPAFFWDFGPSSPAGGPGANAMIATNCDRLEIYVGGQHFATGAPDTAGFGSLAYPPVFVDLTVDGSTSPELRIDGYVGDKQVASLSMSADTTRDRLVLFADDKAITADGSDATRVTFRALDAYGNQRPYVTGDVSLTLTGPAALVGDNPFAFGTYGGVGGAFVRSLPGRTGLATVTAQHATLGAGTVRVVIVSAGPRRHYL
jgi:beta-galactosidase